MAHETIGLLYPGEMGTAIGELLAAQGHTIVTTTKKRSATTRERGARAGFKEVDSIEGVFDRAAMVWSFIHPGGALALAEECGRALARSSRAAGDRPIYIDGNSIAPTTAGRIAQALESHDVDFVDASIHGDAGRLRERSVLYLSGALAKSVATPFADAMRIRILGQDPTAASRFKMTIAGVSKGASALLMEVASFAAQQGVLDAWLEDCRHFYPELMGTMETMLPTYARHAGRRSVELEDMVQTMHDAGVPPGLLSGAQRLVERLSTLDGDPALEAAKQPGTTLDEFLAALGVAFERTDSTDSSTTPENTPSTTREE